MKMAIFFGLVSAAFTAFFMVFLSLGLGVAIQGTNVTSLQAVFVRTLVMFIGLVPLLLLTGDYHALASAFWSVNYRYLAFSGALALGSWWAFTQSAQQLNGVQVLAINALSVLMIAIFPTFVRRLPLTRFDWIGITLMSVGVCIILLGARADQQ